ncbi:MAG: aminoacyl-tRNA hydrolase [Clostridia bacterium]|nr:aminoacyl-tRNA hydrolase [Clostridia bacterium]MBR3145335.1 aminoacyl-tRNA hydrolase [Clostridia bacterium]
MFFRKGKGDGRYLVVGLGNPGIEYENTRHNAGFIALDKFASLISASLTKRKFEALFGEGKSGDKRIIAAKPQTYMNNSGRAVAEISAFYKIPTDRIIIISDDITLPVGNIRIRRKGQSGGHNGLKDIFELLGTEDIIRIKVGVGERENKQGDLVKHVLGKIPKEKAEEFNLATDNAAKAALSIIENGVDYAMNKYSK